MDKDEASYRFPYQHLAVLGMEKLKKYVPPGTSPSSTRPASAPPNGLGPDQDDVR
jgi:hypothetical protein